MKPTLLTLVRWVQPITLGAALEPQTRAGAGTTLTAYEYGVAIVRNGKRVLVPWANIKQADE